VAPEAFQKWWGARAPWSRRLWTGQCRLNACDGDWADNFKTEYHPQTGSNVHRAPKRRRQNILPPSERQCCLHYYVLQSPTNTAWYSRPSVCMSVCNSLTSESLDLEYSFSVFIYIFRISRSKKGQSQSQSHTNKIACLCRLSSSRVVCFRLKGNYYCYCYCYYYQYICTLCTVR